MQGKITINVTEQAGPANTMQPRDVAYLVVACALHYLLHLPVTLRDRHRQTTTEQGYESAPV
jgi:hypothetical protein